MIYKCSIIIPALNINNDVLKCINECLAQEKVKVKIFLITNKRVNYKFKSKKIICLFFGDITMSKKRNLAVKMSKDDYIAFIDSDAYPTKKWIINGIKCLNKNKNIAMVTGPDLPFKNQKGWSLIISLAHKSILLSGTKIFRKNLRKEKICDQASSCNMIIKKNAYQKVGGMDSKIYIGEDKDLCDRINEKYKILHSPKVLIYHKVRDFIPFILQRFSYGTCIYDIIKNNRKISFNNFQYFIPLLITIFYILLPISLIFNIFHSFTILILFILNFIIFLESFRIALFDLLKLIKIFFVIKISIFSFGLGSLMFFLGAKKIKKIYRKR